MGSGYADKIVLSVGGSLVAPSGIDTDFLSDLNKFIREQIASDDKRRFFLVIGGGMTSRNYQNAARVVIGHEVPNEDLDWLGVHSTRLNAHLVRSIFRDIAHPNILKDYSIIRKVTEPVVVAAGWKPGWSTDFCATMICQDYNARKIINMSNINQVYDKDPKKFSDAKSINHMTWDEMRSLVGNVWIPSMHAPFDPIASRKAQELGIKVVVLNGKDIENVKKYIKGEKFLGTVIE